MVRNNTNYCINYNHYNIEYMKKRSLDPECPPGEKAAIKVLAKSLPSPDKPKVIYVEQKNKKKQKLIRQLLMRLIINTMKRKKGNK